MLDALLAAPICCLLVLRPLFLCLPGKTDISIFYFKNMDILHQAQPEDRTKGLDVDKFLDNLSPFERLPTELVWAIFDHNQLYQLRNLRQVSDIEL